MTRHNEPTVLIVDDDEAVRDSLSMVLRAAGRPVEAFASAEEFIERGGASRTGCLILDVRMPGMSGLELQEYLAERNAPLPIVFLTGDPDPDKQFEVLEIGATGRADLPQAEYLNILRKKTATFVEGCCRCGALLAGAATTSHQHALRHARPSAGSRRAGLPDHLRPPRGHRPGRSG